MKDRISQARQGFLEKDFYKTRISHTSRAIRNQIMHEEGNRSDYNLPVQDWKCLSSEWFPLL